MNDLRARFDSLDRMIVPDVWGEVQRRIAVSGTAGAQRPVARVIPGPPSWKSQPRTGNRSVERGRAWWLVAAALVAVALFAGVLMAGSNRLLSVVVPSPSELLSAPVLATPSPTVATASPSRSSGPANGLIAYSSNGQIFVAAPDGTNRRALTAASGNAFAPRWSPDGKRLAFLSLSCAVSQPCDQKASPASLLVMNPDGSGQTVVEENLRNIQVLEWSPDGRHLAFEGDVPSGFGVVAFGGSGYSAIGDGQSPRWSPDGTTVAYDGLDGIHLVAADGTGDHLLLQPTAAGTAFDPRWSPDGTQLAFFWLRPCCPPANRGSDAMLVDRSGNFPHRMSEVPAGGSFEGWSPDGRFILYLEATRPDPPFAWMLVMANSDGSAARSVASPAAVHWSPNGSRLFGIERLGDSPPRLVIIDPTGATPELDIPADDASWQSIP